MSLKKNTVISAAVIALLTLGAGLSSCSKQKPESAPGAAALAAADALNFQLKHVNGDMFDLNSLKGKVLIVDFWDTWCPPCKKEIPGFIDIKNRYKNENFEIVGIAFARDGFDAVRRFAQDNKMNYPVLVADRLTIPELFKVYGTIQAIPTTFIIDRNGAIAEKLEGYHPVGEFEKRIKRLMTP